MQSNDTLQYPRWEGANRLISPSFDTLVVDSVHPLESKESHLSSYHSINVQSMDPIQNIFTDSCPVTTNDNNMHSHINLAKLPILDGVSFEGSKVV